MIVLYSGANYSTFADADVFRDLFVCRRQHWVAAGGFEFIGGLEEELAQKACEAFGTILPFQDRLVYARWSGQPMRIPFAVSGNLEALGQRVSWEGAQEIAVNYQ